MSIVRALVLATIFAALLPNMGAYAATKTKVTPDRKFGAGIILGDPTGFTGKYWLNTERAVDGGLAWSANDFFLVYGDYLFHFPGLFGSSHEARQFKPYVGAGAVLMISTESNRHDGKLFSEDGSVGLGFRIPLGVEWRPDSVPIGAFVELVPGVGFIPSTFGFVEGGIGIRYYF